MEDAQLTEAVERFARGEMNAEEQLVFEEMRKNNPELDQLVVEQLFFLNELDRYGNTRNFRHILNETEGKLVNEGVITKSPLQGQSKLVYLWKRYKRIVAVAASIAGIISIISASLTLVFNNRKTSNINLLVSKLNQQDKEILKIKNKTDKLAAASVTPVTPEPIMDVKFRATGFMIDASNNFIITNAHVVKEAKHRLIIENNKGSQFKAEAIYIDAATDLAILKVTDDNFRKLPPMPYSIRKSNARLGEQVFMLGFPKQEIVYGEGYISAKNGYQMDTIYCQLNTSANEGSSGSPVITKNGELLGIITSMETNAEGVVYAIKAIHIFKAIDEVKKMKDYQDIRITSKSTLKGADRVSQIEKVEDYVFMVKGN